MEQSPDPPIDYDGLRVCGLSEDFSTSLDVRRSPVATWRYQGNLNLDVLTAIQQAFDRWTAVANVRGREARPDETPSLIITTQRLDGPQGVLADCELPGPQVQRMRLDTSERWVIVTGPNVPVSQIDLLRVLTHELGHFWGIGHIGPGNLMAPTYSTRIESPQSGDIREMQERYGPPVPQQPPTPPPPGQPITIHIYGADRIVIPGYTVTRNEG